MGGATGNGAIINRQKHRYITVASIEKVRIKQHFLFVYGLYLFTSNDKNLVNKLCARYTNKHIWTSFGFVIEKGLDHLFQVFLQVTV